jgi:alpha-methylacyl-CoA racemase
VPAFLLSSLTNVNQAEVWRLYAAAHKIQGFLEVLGQLLINTLKILKWSGFMGPLEGIKVIEFAGIGPAPMCAMLLADLGATVLRIERPDAGALGVPRPLKYNLLLRGRQSITVDLKTRAGVDFVLELLEGADVAIEGFRPGAMERIGLGPDQCLQRNPRLVFGRMTGWGQEGPLAQMAGHDLNYIAISGALHAIGRKGQPPTPPLNLVGDFGGGALYMAFGLMAGLLSARATGKGQVVDAAMVDGAASLMTSFYGMAAGGLLKPERGVNVLDSGAPYYDVYECADGKYLSVASIEGKFRKELFKLLELGPDVPDGVSDADWPVLRETIAARIRRKTRDEWGVIFAGSDACVAPVLTVKEAPMHPHSIARKAFIEVDGVTQPAPAPRFSATPAGTPLPPQAPDADVWSALREWGLGSERIVAWTQAGVVNAVRPAGG